MQRVLQPTTIMPISLQKWFYLKKENFVVSLDLDLKGIVYGTQTMERDSQARTRGRA